MLHSTRTTGVGTEHRPMGLIYKGAAFHDAAEQGDLPKYYPGENNGMNQSA